MFFTKQTPSGNQELYLVFFHSYEFQPVPPWICYPNSYPDDVIIIVTLPVIVYRLEIKRAICFSGSIITMTLEIY